jgi:wyosine [tRNA(Phe)-imidazoG37] synthetase (radical SAM superfamily)
MANEKKYIFGPVPSRRLGLSLGVDIVPFKVCSLDCTYCQVGATTDKTIERKEYVPADEVIAELKETLDQGTCADYISITGSGEPTLNSQLGPIIKNIKKISKIPVAVITNGSLLFDPAVRADCAAADVVLPSLDAADDQTFQIINRPHSRLSVQSLIDGLAAFRSEYKGQIWLEVFLIEGVNTSPDKIEKLAAAISAIAPDKIQLNTAVRPTTEKGVKKVSLEKLTEIAQSLGDNCEVVADFHHRLSDKAIKNRQQSILSMLKRRPCSIEDITSALGIPKDQLKEMLKDLQNQKLVTSTRQNDTTFYAAAK